MSVTIPYYRTMRQSTNGSYRGSGQALFIHDPDYAKEPEQYIRAFLLLQKDLKNLFDYVETADTNLPCYSFRIHELLMRACTEVEANFKAIFAAHGYSPTGIKGKSIKLTMNHYNKTECTHRLSSYEVKVPHWRGTKGIRQPFKSWAQPTKPNPAWYEAYHVTKHNRHEGFEHANFENLIDAVCGLLLLLTSQFLSEDFSPASPSMSLCGYGFQDGMEPAIGDYFRVKLPNWLTAESYDFTYAEWKILKQNGTPFQTIDYSKI